MASNSSEQKASTKLCGNCKKDVLAANYDMHTVHCQRFVRYCDYCDQSFPKSDWDGHIETNHGEVCCKDCGKTVAKKFLEEHVKNDCRFRQQTCKYCELSLPFFKSREHEDFCGSRTELCPRCNKYIQLRDLDAHFCDIAAPATSMAPSGNGEIFDDDIGYGAGGDFDDDLQDVPPYEPLRMCEYCHKLEQSLGMSLGEHKDVCPEQPVSCKYCPEKVPMLFLESHEAICPGMMIICPTCHDSVRMEQVDRHSDTCRPRGVGTDQPGRQFPDFGGCGRQSPGPSLNDFDGLGIKEGKVRLPCEFCHELFSIDMLIQHESGCDRAGPFGSSSPRLRE